MLFRQCRLQPDCVTMQNRVLLVVDDEPGLGEIIKEYLEEWDFAVEVATNAHEAWELLEQNPPDLMIIDIMPEVDGYQFLKTVRANPRFETLPVVLLYAKETALDQAQEYQVGYKTYLPKPFDPDELVAIIENRLNRHRLIANENGDEPIPEEETLGDHKTAPPPPKTIQLPPPYRNDLTPREQMVLALLAEGLTDGEIAQRLGTSFRNVEKYVRRLLSKKGLSSRTELVNLAVETSQYQRPFLL